MNYDIVILTDISRINLQQGNSGIENVFLEDKLVLEALEKIGFKVTRKSWDDSEFDWTTTRYVIFRSNWDCFDRFPEFANWLNDVSGKTKLINSKKLITWNIDKHYLKDLAANGVAIPKTLFVEQGQTTTLSDTYKKATENYGFINTSLVLKPCVSGGARHTYKILPSEIAQYEEVFQELIVNEAMMLQEFQHNIITKGEISMMVFNGKFTNAVLKIAKQGDFRVQDDFGGSVQEYKPSQEEISFAEKAVASAPELPIYARVDIFRDNDENLALAELEIFEPELWFRLFPNAANVLAKSIKDRLF